MTDPMNNPEQKGGVYLYLFHGRKDPNEQMDDWGEQGPILGPLDYFHTTYSSNPKIAWSENGREVGNAMLDLVDDMIFYDGMYYGDWSVTTIDRLGENPKIEQFDPNKAVPPKTDVPSGDWKVGIETHSGSATEIAEVVKDYLWGHYSHTICEITGPDGKQYEPYISVELALSDFQGEDEESELAEA